MTEDNSARDRQAMSESLARALPQLTPQQIAQVSPTFKRVTYPPGEVIVRQDDPPQRFYIVLRGRAEVLHTSAGGHTHTVDERRPGDYFGEIGLLKNRPRTATVRAADEEVEMLVLEREDFLALVKASRGTESQVTQDLIQHMINLAHYQE